MAKQGAWESTTDHSSTDNTMKSRNGKKWALLAGGLALAGAGVALTKGRKARKPKRK